MEYDMTHSEKTLVRDAMLFYAQHCKECATVRNDDLSRMWEARAEHSKRLAYELTK